MGPSYPAGETRQAEYVDCNGCGLFPLIGTLVGKAPSDRLLLSGRITAAAVDAAVDAAAAAVPIIAVPRACPTAMVALSTAATAPITRCGIVGAGGGALG